MPTLNEQVNSAIVTVLKKRGAVVSAKQLVPEATIYEDLGFDSLNTVELALELEERFGFEVSDDDAEAINTYGDIISLVERRTSG